MTVPRTACRFAISLLALVGWLAASNYCALAAAASQTFTSSEAHACCGGHKAPVKNSGNDGSECCRSFPVASILDLSGVIAPSDIYSAVGLGFAATVIPMAALIPGLVPIEWDTGPPRADSFAQSVLGRSLRAHAPPSVG